MPTGAREPSSDYTPDLFTVRAKLGWRPTTSLDRGLRTMLSEEIHCGSDPMVAT
jgi:nucleoside-diphosphate-sugar epimerase